ncbi:MAG: hypothetical protein IPO19_00375 [Rhodoferax sp.]|nr:hypothetical protein [Rhodoferax sp.]
MISNQSSAALGEIQMNRSNASNPGLHRALAGLLLAVSVGAAAQGTNCGALTNGNGPWDYRKERASIKLVEDFHFTPNVEALIGGATGPIGGDLDYTLRASPNHHKALIAVSRLSARLKTDQIPSMKYTVDCWFDRAFALQARRHCGAWALCVAAWPHWS